MISRKIKDMRVLLTYLKNLKTKKF